MATIKGAAPKLSQRQREVIAQLWQDGIVLPNGVRDPREVSLWSLCRRGYVGYRMCPAGWLFELTEAGRAALASQEARDE